MSKKNTRRKVLKAVGVSGLSVSALSLSATANGKEVNKNDNFDACDELGDFIGSPTLDLNNGYGVYTTQISPNVNKIRFHTVSMNNHTIDGLYIYNPYQEDRSDGDTGTSGATTQVVVTRTDFPGSELRIEVAVEDDESDGSITSMLFECDRLR
ncbi:hypothetical protein [Natrialba aegyptia]|uniref:hypothetical protein n=1 Tax=Natrialba aegyptia TaxID=129789 RepID=UPI00126958FA|nr:hypothetical protein [Natrialba aegyptia]